MIFFKKIFYPIDYSDLIVMGIHGRTGITQNIIGNVAESIIRNAHCPVLCIRDY